MKKISDAMKWFCYITTAILVVCTVIIMTVGEQAISPKTLPQILLSGFLTTIITTLLQSKEETKKSIIYIKCFLHYIALCVVMVICGKWFGWLEFNFRNYYDDNSGGMCIYIGFLTYYIIDLKQADAINQRLKKSIRMSQYILKKVNHNMGFYQYQPRNP